MATHTTKELDDATQELDGLLHDLAAHSDPELARKLHAAMMAFPWTKFGPAKKFQLLYWAIDSGLGDLEMNAAAFCEK